MKIVKGFTIIELIIVIAIVVILSALATPFLGASYDRSNIEVSAFDLQQSLRDALSRSMSGQGNSNWGVYVQSDSFTLYKGDSYSNRDTAYDLMTESQGGVIFAGLDDINFSKTLGLPSQTGNITVNDPDSSETKTININSMARIEVQ